MSSHIFAFKRRSGNEKTGPIPVTTTSMNSCPLECPLRGNGCYAGLFRLGEYWRALSAGERAGMDLAGLTAKIAKLPEGQLWRHNQAGDLPGDGRCIDSGALAAIVYANLGRRGFTYTHYDPWVGGNAKAIKAANAAGFTVNLSANSLRQADELYTLGIGPVVAIVEPGGPQSGVTPAGRKYTVCPAQTRDDVSCATCQLCQRQRDVIVAFEAHGASKRRVINIARAAA